MGLLAHRPRALNVLADAVATLCLKEDRSFCWMNPSFKIIPKGYLRVSTDGGYREGHASCAAVVEFLSDDLNESAIVAVAGRVLFCL